MKMASRSVDLISKKTNFSRAARFFDFLRRCFAPPQSPLVRLRPCLHGLGEPGLVG